MPRFSSLEKRCITQACVARARHASPLIFAEIIGGPTRFEPVTSLPDGRQAHCPDNSGGGPYRARTGHLHIANVTLYQMS